MGNNTISRPGTTVSRSRLPAIESGRPALETALLRLAWLAPHSSRGVEFHASRTSPTHSFQGLSRRGWHMYILWEGGLNVICRVTSLHMPSKASGIWMLRAELELQRSCGKSGLPYCWNSLCATTDGECHRCRIRSSQRWKSQYRAV